MHSDLAEGRWHIPGVTVPVQLSSDVSWPSFCEAHFDTGVPQSTNTGISDFEKDCCSEYFTVVSPQKPSRFCLLEAFEVRRNCPRLFCIALWVSWRAVGSHVSSTPCHPRNARPPHATLGTVYPCKANDSLPESGEATSLLRPTQGYLPVPPMLELRTMSHRVHRVRVALQRHLQKCGRARTLS